MSVASHIVKMEESSAALVIIYAVSRRKTIYVCVSVAGIIAQEQYARFAWNKARD
jgi:hypothetical protein